MRLRAGGGVNRMERERIIIKINPYEILGEMILRSLIFDEQIKEWVETSGWLERPEAV